jgi:hypothetical protein
MTFTKKVGVFSHTQWLQPKRHGSQKRYGQSPRATYPLGTQMGDERSPGRASGATDRPSQFSRREDTQRDEAQTFHNDIDQADLSRLADQIADADKHRDSPPSSDGCARSSNEAPWKYACYPLKCARQAG